MRTKYFFASLAIVLLPITSIALPTNTDNNETLNDSPIALNDADCNEGETYCGDGVFEMCKNGEWVVVEDCNAAGKMCNPNGSGCLECIPAKNNSTENATLIQPDYRIESILCTSTCEDWYKIEVPAGKALFVSINWDGGGGVYLDMYDNSGTKNVSWLNEAMEIGYTNDTNKPVIFYLKASNDSSNQRFSRYSFEPQILDEYTPRVF